MTLPVTWSIRTTQEQTGLGRESVYALIRRGEIEAIRLSPDVRASKLLVIPESVVAWRDRQREQQATPAHAAVNGERPRTSRGRS